jgi:separase
MANLTLHNVHQRFQSDMFLNSLTESSTLHDHSLLNDCLLIPFPVAIAIPMGMSSKTTIQRMLPINDVLNALDSAEKYFQDNIALTGKTGDIVQLRNGAVSLTLVKAFQTSLGRLEDRNAVYAASLLGTLSLFSIEIAL